MSVNLVQIDKPSFKFSTHPQFNNQVYTDTKFDLNESAGLPNKVNQLIFYRRFYEKILAGPTARIAAATCGLLKSGYQK